MVAKFRSVSCTRFSKNKVPQTQKWKSKVANFDLISMVYLTIILSMGVGYYEVATIISYPTNASEIIVLLRTLAKYRSILLQHVDRKRQATCGGCA